MKNEYVQIEIGEFRSLVKDVKVGMGVLEFIEGMGCSLNGTYSGEIVVRETIDRLVDTVYTMDDILAKGVAR
jgi:hypothetical protein